MTDHTSRRLILHMSVSLDGFVARRDGVIDWMESGEHPGSTKSHSSWKFRA